ncbi:MAG: 4-(cytidine 5'-diphospho)-2-C-methyl-D-erythritol kinase [Desulfovibrionaceae bacterium]|nr:4-(cytidine 5'-diphospho)-2-C-methyl-D-erythritol kinase [Desulfovibrionaceae bacterium]
MPEALDAPARLRTGGKINLFLRITGRRPDGYHELSTLFVRLPEPCDELFLRPRAGTGLRLRCAAPGIDPGRNTLTRAYALYAEATGFAPGLEAELVKGIPLGAGLGGGSADAALLLGWLQANCPEPLDGAALNSLAVRVGADVPFFFASTACHGQGVGECLTPCRPPLDGVYGLLLCPELRIDTAWAYAAWDRENAAGTLTAGGGADKNHRSGFLWPWTVENCFEPVVFAAHPHLARLKTRLVREGAAAAGMSGSGSALFGLFRDEAAARRASCRLRQEKAAVHGPFVFPGYDSPGGS